MGATEAFLKHRSKAIGTAIAAIGTKIIFEQSSRVSLCGRRFTPTIAYDLKTAILQFCSATVGVSGNAMGHLQSGFVFQVIGGGLLDER
jgi:hypothetical protein